nr:HPF/RaiA family ribosome-associated protein [Bacteroidota bacterium]
MKVQVNTDKNIDGNVDLFSHVENVVGSSLSQFEDKITRVEAHLSDVNSSKSGGDDKRCVLEARMAGMQPITVTHQAETLDHALYGASDKLKRALDNAVGKQRSR